MDPYKAQADKWRRITDIKPGDQMVVVVKYFMKQILAQTKSGPKYIGPFWETHVVGKKATSFEFNGQG